MKKLLFLIVAAGLVYLFDEAALGGTRFYRPTRPAGARARGPRQGPRPSLRGACRPAPAP